MRCALFAALAAYASASPAGAAVHRAGPVSPYPAGAERPLLRPSSGQFARSAQTGGAPAGGSPAPGSRPAGSPAGGGKRLVPKKGKPALHGNPARALVGFRAMQKVYFVPASNLYLGEPYSYLWAYSQAFAATVSMAFIPHLGVDLAREVHARLAGLNAYLDTDNSGAPEGTFTSALPAFDGSVAPPAGPGGIKYYDDNDWVALELVRLYELTHSQALLGSAEGIMAFEMAGWQSNANLGCPGGIPFSNAPGNTERNTVTTAPTAELGAQLYRLTHNPEYLRFALQAYAWVRACLLTPTGLYADHVNRRGVAEPMLWSYNQGTMIGAGALLYQATHNSAYLYDARQTGKAALAYFTPQRLGGEIPFFASVYFRNLLYLDSITHDPPGPKAAQAYVDYAWTHLRLKNGLFVAGSPAGAQLLVQAAIVQIYALLSSPPRTYF